MATEDTIMTAAEYSESVYQWLQQAHQWQALAVGKSQVFGILIYSWTPQNVKVLHQVKIERFFYL